MGKKARKPQSSKQPANGASHKPRDETRAALFWACIAVLMVVPLVFSVSAYRIFIFPKFATLLVGSSLVLALTFAVCNRIGLARALVPLRSVNVALAVMFLIPVTISTFFGVDPLATFWGSSSIQIGLLSRLCFLVVFVGLIVGIGDDPDRFRVALWAVAATGLVIAGYAFVQFVGRDPFLPARLYTQSTSSGGVMRTVSTLGHSNYLGNILMYIAPISLGLSVASSGRSRRIAILVFALATAAVAFSGTRGAWIGLVSGVLVFVLLASRDRRAARSGWTRGKLLRAAILVAACAIAAVVIVLSPASRSIGARARMFATDRLTGSGRTLLWRDSLRMAVNFPLVGCGPEGFSKAFPAYKSIDVVHLSPNSSDESSHNSFLDAAISFGFGGAILYAALIGSAAARLIKTRRETDRRMNWLAVGLISALAAVSVHNLFIYDQIPTGLYFFVLMALAVSFGNVSRSDADRPTVQARSTPRRVEALLWKTAAAGAIALTILAVWYSFAGMEAEVAIKRSLAAARAGDFDAMVSSGMRAVTKSLDPTKPYHSLFARALATYVEVKNRVPSQGGDEDELNRLRSRAAEMGIEYGEQAAIHSLTPAADYSLLADLALSINDTGRAHEFAEQSLKWDPRYYRSHLLLAKTELADGNREVAAREARIALTLNRSAWEATALLSQIGAEPPEVKERIRILIQRAKAVSAGGNSVKAFALLKRALALSALPCPDCHEALAEIYEKAGRLEEALSEWKELSVTATEFGVRERAQSKVAELSEKVKGVGRK